MKTLLCLHAERGTIFARILFLSLLRISTDLLTQSCNAIYSAILLFCSCNKAPWLRQLIKGRIYLSSRGIKGHHVRESSRQEVAGGRFCKKNWELTPVTASRNKRKSTWNVTQLLKLQSLPSVPYFPQQRHTSKIYQNSTTNCGPSIKPMEYIFFQTTTNAKLWKLFSLLISLMPEAHYIFQIYKIVSLYPRDFFLLMVVKVMSPLYLFSFFLMQIHLLALCIFGISYHFHHCSHLKILVLSFLHFFYRSSKTPFRKETLVFFFYLFSRNHILLVILFWLFKSHIHVVHNSSQPLISIFYLIFNFYCISVFI